MPLDPSIIGGFRPPEVMSPVNAMAQMYQLRALQGESEKNQLAMEKTRREMDREQTINRLMSAAGGNQQDFLRGLERSNLGSMVPEYKEKFAKSDEATYKAGQEKYKYSAEFTKNARANLNYVKTAEDAKAWALAPLRDPIMRDVLTSQGVTEEKVVAGIDDSWATGTQDKWLLKAAESTDQYTTRMQMADVENKYNDVVSNQPPNVKGGVIQVVGNPIRSLQMKADIAASEGYPETAKFYMDQADKLSADAERRKTTNIKDFERGLEDPRFNSWLLSSRRAGATNVTQNAGERLSPGQRKIDERFAEEWIEWTKGGRAQAEANSRTMNEVIGTIKAGKRVSGPEYGILPDAILSLTKGGQVAIKTRQDVERIAQIDLRHILGAQFGQVEGENFLKRVFDPKLEGPQLLDRLARIYAHMEIARQQKEAMVEYFNKNDGSLKGYKGPIPSVADFEKAALGKGAAAPAAGGGTSIQKQADEILRGTKK